MLENTFFRHKTYKRYVMITTGMLLYLPMVLIYVLSFYIWLKVRKRFNMSRRLSNCATGRKRVKEKKAAFQLALVVASFTIGYLPMAG